ncbi:MAG TPA: hypothetical protein ENJ78_00555 [candidate division WWE3 bacterium]|uniref:Cell division protein FtsL n=1 Tax=candidate division WWE3 bacterium TaxID=2053526 RepID=A0A7V5J027_UNCKA|nr:hypothetical protein [candidate division WWE3 bacterium]
MNLTKKTKILIYLLIALPAIVSVVYNIYIANTLVITGIKLYKLEGKIKELELSNKQLTLEIARYSDYGVVLSRAKDLGMKANSVSFVKLPDYTLASKN